MEAVKNALTKMEGREDGKTKMDKCDLCGINEREIYWARGREVCRDCFQKNSPSFGEDGLKIIPIFVQKDENQKQNAKQAEVLAEAIKALTAEVKQRMKELHEENERLRAELEQRPPKLIITKLPKKETENV